MLLTAEPLGNTALGMDVTNEVVTYLPVSKPTGIFVRYIRPSATVVGDEIAWDNNDEITWDNLDEIAWDE